MNILILAALGEELSPVRDALRARYQFDFRVNFEYHRIPVGINADLMGLENRLDTGSVDMIINIGTAGALSKTLNLFDVFFPISFQANGKQKILLKALLRDSAQLLNTVPNYWKRGAIYTSAIPVISESQKTVIGTYSNGLAVDMEAARLAQFCRSREITFCALKVISDTADSNTNAIFKRSLKKAAEILSSELSLLIDLILNNREGASADG